MNWISVKDRLPSFGEKVLAFGYRQGNFQNETYDIYTAQYHPDYNIQEGWELDPTTRDSFALYGVIYWMPLPEEPKGARVIFEDEPAPLNEIRITGKCTCVYCKKCEPNHACDVRDIVIR